MTAPKEHPDPPVAAPVHARLRAAQAPLGPVQVIGRFVVALSFLVAPLLAVAAATATTTHLQAVADAEAAERSRTRAVLLEDAPGPHARPQRLRRLLGPARPGAGRMGRARWDVAGGDRAGPAPHPGRHGRAGVGGPPGQPHPAPLDRAGIPSSAAATGPLPLIGVPWRPGPSTPSSASPWTPTGNAGGRRTGPRSSRTGTPGCSSPEAAVSRPVRGLRTESSLSSASRASRAATRAWTGMWPAATSWPPERRSAAANGAAQTFS